MLEKIEVGNKSLEDYRFFCGDDLTAELELLRRELRGIRVCHINSTPFGGGVAELLYSCVALLRGMGIKAEWRIISASEQFFSITKSFHNALQGAEHSPTKQELDTYMATNAANAQRFVPAYDVIIVHDPQPAAIRSFSRNGSARWIWRCHIDTSAANPHVLGFLKPYISNYDQAIFSLGEFIPSDLQLSLLQLIPPGIDPLSPKNQELPLERCVEFVKSRGLDTDRPIVTQVSRFDIWKDPLGVVAAYRMAKEDIPGLQLVLIGSLARDDPEGLSMIESVEAEVEGDRDVFIFYNLPDIEVNAFQRVSDIVIQKSIREGFGLTVSEAMWKSKAVIGGDTGGIALQLGGELSELLVDSVEECAQKIVKLLRNPNLAKMLGSKGRERVRGDFLIPRMLRDELIAIRLLLSR